MNVTHFDIAKNLPPGSDVNIDKTTETSYDKPGQFNLNGGIIPRQVKQLGDPMTVALKNDDSVRDYNVEPAYDSSTNHYTLTENLVLRSDKPGGVSYLAPKVPGADSYYMEDKVQPWNSLSGFVNNVNDSLYRSATGFHYLNTDVKIYPPSSGSSTGPSPPPVSSSKGKFVSDTLATAIGTPDPDVNPDLFINHRFLIYNRETNFNPAGAFDEYLIHNTSPDTQTFKLSLLARYLEYEEYSLDYGRDTDKNTLNSLNCTDSTDITQELGTFTFKPGEVRRVSPVMHYKKDGTPLQNIILLPSLKQRNSSSYVKLLTCENVGILVTRISFGYKINENYYRGVNWTKLVDYEGDQGTILVDQSKKFNYQYNYTFPSIQMEGLKVTYMQDYRDAFSLKMNDTGNYRLNLSDTEQINIERAQGVEGSIFKHPAKIYDQSFGAQFDVDDDGATSPSPLGYTVNATGLTEGNGYHLNQVIVVDGSLLGGTTTNNDLTMTLSSVSTLTLTASGTPVSGLSSTNIVHANGATFTVTAAGGAYSVSASGLTKANGYHDGQIITIAGDDLSGVTPFNDLTLRISAEFTPAVSGTAVAISETTINDISNLRLHIRDASYANCLVESFTPGTSLTGSTDPTITHTIKGGQLGGTDTTHDLTLTSHNQSLSGSALVSSDNEQVVQTTAKRDLESSVLIRQGDSDAIYNDLQYIMATVGNDFTGEQSSSSTTTQRGNYVVYIPVDKDDDQNYHDVMSNVGPLQIDNNNNRVKVDFKGVCYNPTTGEVEYVPLKNSNKRKRMMHVNAEMRME